jgi:hypothetical protein
MKISQTMKDKLQEANRYYENALNALKKAKKEGEYYKDNKYTRSCGDFAWKAILFATEYLLDYSKINYIPEQKSKRINIQYYIRALNELRKKKPEISSIMKNFDNLYEFLHKSLGYDGITDAKLINIAMQRTKKYLTDIKKLTH